jgi:ribonuclease R
MPEFFKSRIIRLLKHTDYKPLKLAHLARALGVNADGYPQFKEAFDQLQKAGGVVIGARSLVSLPPMSGQIIGTFRANPKGFGFVIPLEPNSHGDLFIPAKATAGAVTGDTVSAKVLKRGKRAGQMRLSGKIVDILERTQSKIVGTLFKRPDGWIVQPDGGAFTEPICIDDVTAKGAKQKDKVVVEILTWPTEKYLARGVITELLGRAGQYETEIKSIIHQYHLPGEFAEDCLEQSRKAAKQFDAAHAVDREDITDKVVITIDPPTAKDFDDAISLTKDKSGNFTLGVHIADVSNFIKPGSALDIEAADRGNSTYLPGWTIPMLPEILSNGICSLQPNQKRFCKSVYLTYDKDANVTSRRFANSLVCSTQRLTYLQADKIIKGSKKGTTPEVIELLKNMESLSRLIEQRRRKNGMLELDMPEVELIMDKAGQITDARPADDCYPHTIIEMFMVEANEAVASIIDKRNVPLMRRIHPEPNALSLQNLSKLVKAFGISIPKTPDRFAIQGLLASVDGADCSMAINLMVLRSLERAQYSSLNMGHFALASRHYCHFTSPIRRYADLLIHRQLQCYLENNLDASSVGVDLSEVGKHITFTEQRSQDAERELKNVLILLMLSKRIGSELDCLVSGIAGFGIFVQSKRFGIEGLIQMDDLPGDVWKYDQKNQCVVGQHSGQMIRLGRPIKVKIVSVNIPARQLNICPVQALFKPARQKSKIKLAKKVKKRRTKTTKRKGKKNK